MKKLNSILTLLMMVIISSAFTFNLESGKIEFPSNAEEIIWTNDFYDLGEIEKDVVTLAEFTFTNNSSEAYVIASVKTSCGCTIAEYPKEPILPGESGTIKTTYDAKKVGPFLKTVTVTGNNQSGSKTLTFKGVVIE